MRFSQGTFTHWGNRVHHVPQSILEFLVSMLVRVMKAIRTQGLLGRHRESFFATQSELKASGGPLELLNIELFSPLSQFSIILV